MRCYFNLVNGYEKILDQDGIEVLDLKQAYAQALKAIEELQEDDRAAEDWHDWALEIADGSGRGLLSIPLNGILH